MGKTTPEQDLLRDLESYACGEIPSALELLRAPLIEDWSTEVRRVGKEFKLVVQGLAKRHPEYDDGEMMGTPAVIWFDRHGRFVRCPMRLYALGHAAE